MADLRTMTLEKLRAMARKLLGPGHSRFKTRAALLEALRAAAGQGVEPGPGAGAKAKPAARGKVRRARPAPPPATGEGGLDPDGFFVARVRGEDAVRGAPHPMAAAGVRPPAGTALLHDERLGELPAGYGEDTLVILPRDPHTLFVYWDHAEDTLREGFRGLDRPRVELWVWARAGDGWERVRRVELALESRGWYLHGLDPGRTYRVELRAVGGDGRARLLGPGSGDAGLPPSGPSPVVDDRFVRLPWDRPLGPRLGPGHPGAEFPVEAREALARLTGGPADDGGPWVGSGGPGGRPVSGGAGRPTSPGGARWGEDEGER